jgi:biotin-dependent carboxylase-like uncharacterized protein
MKLLKILKPGLMMTVQDRGRHGLLRSGVSRSGPMDQSSFDIAMALVGNGPDAAGLEFAYIGGTLEVTEPVYFAVTGGAVEIRIDGAMVPAWESHQLLPGQILTIGGLRDAVWGYIAISGGVDTPAVLGSRATHLRTAIGGLEGRALVEGDELPLGDCQTGKPRRLTSMWRRRRGAIRVIAGPQDDYFDRQAWDMFLKTPFSVSNKRDRMAMMLDGPAIVAAKGNDIVSDATLSGSIQVPGSGHPIVLMADRQTTGGYPKIATVSSVDLPRLAQMPTGSSFRFTRIAQHEAETMLIAERQALRDVIRDLGQQ